MTAGRLGGMLRASAGSALGSSAGALLPFVISGMFSAGGETDAFFLTYGASLAVASVFSVVLERAALPFAVEAAARGRDCLATTAIRFSAQVGAAAMGAALAMTALLLWLLPALGLDAGQRALSTLLAVALLPLPALMAVSGVASAALFALGRFGLPTTSAVGRAGTALAAGLLFGRTVGLPAVALGLVAGEALRAGLLLHLVTRGTRGTRGTVSRSSPSLPARPLWATVGPHLLSMAVVTMSPLVDKAVAARLVPGSVTVLELCDKLFYAPLILVGTGAAIVGGTAWSQMAQQGETRRLADDYWRLQRVLLLASSVIAVAALAGVALVEPALRTFAGIGPELPFLTVFAAVIVGLPFAVSADLGVRLLTAHRRTRVLVVTAVALLALNTGADLVGVALLGLPGIAISSTLVRVTNAGFFLVLSLRLLAPRPAPLPA